MSHRTRDLPLLALLVVGLTACPPPPPAPPPQPTAIVGGEGEEPPPPLPDDTVRIATFNIQVFGKTKREKPAVMQALVTIARQYDLIAIQEIKDASGDTPPAFLDAINAASGPDYAMVVSPRTGTTAGTSSKEQYAFYFNTERIVALDAGALYPDPADAFVREPWVARFQADHRFTFVLLDIHTRPDDAVAEIGALHDAITWAKSQYPDEDDFIALGDYNASCSYATPADLDALTIRSSSYLWIVPDDADTNLASSACAYDRIVTTADTASDYAGAWGVDRSFTDSDVSDHWPVWADFFSKRDGAPPCCKVCTMGKACGDGCIAQSATCSAGPGCACDD